MYLKIHLLALLVGGGGGGTDFQPQNENRPFA